MGEVFWPGDLGFIIGELVGGPLDGRRYGDIAVPPGGADQRLHLTRCPEHIATGDVPVPGRVARRQCVEGTTTSVRGRAPSGS